MKSFAPRDLVLLGLGLRLCAASTTPLLQWDPETVSTCLEWYNNGGSESCESVRDMFNISPELFHEWNPSVGLDCKPWRYQSYCIFTEERLSSLTTTTTMPVTTTSTSSSSSHVPSPSSWTMRACYADEDPELPIMETNMSEDGGDDSLTVEGCEDTCWRASVNGSVLFAGLKRGNQCWCSDYIAGESARNQSSCDLPCTGNDDQICGGKDFINVYEPLTTDWAPEPTGTSPTDTSLTATSTSLASSAIQNGGSGGGDVVDEVTHDSGAVRYRALF